MRTPTRLWLLLSWLLSWLPSLFAAPVFAQAPASPLATPPVSINIMRVDPAVQRERDTTRMGILQEELAKETGELAAAENEWHGAQASGAPSGKVQEITQRVTLHRQNVTALEREIALAERPANSAIHSTSLRDSAGPVRGRQPDDWLIAGQRLSVVEQNSFRDSLVRRRLPLSEPSVIVPQWIIQAGFTGIGP